MTTYPLKSIGMSMIRKEEWGGTHADVQMNIGYNIRIAEEEQMRVVCDYEELVNVLTSKYVVPTVTAQTLAKDIITNLPLWVKIVSNKGEL